MLLPKCHAPRNTRYCIDLPGKRVFVVFEQGGDLYAVVTWVCIPADDDAWPPQVSMQAGCRHRDNAPLPEGTLWDYYPVLAWAAVHGQRASTCSDAALIMIGAL